MYEDCQSEQGVAASKVREIACTNSNTLDNEPPQINQLITTMHSSETGPGVTFLHIQQTKVECSKAGYPVDDSTVQNKLK